tara:strand:+ start:138931 stop:140115 length:1185 start_codon:yes stop_codon:yes gene_type:complete
VNTEIKNFEFKGGLQKLSLSLMAVGALALIASFSLDHTVGWVDYLVNTVFFVTMSVSGLFFLSITGVLQASWLTPMKRIPESMTKFLPIGFILMLAVYFGMHTIYEWTHTEMVMNDPILSQKTAWLNVPGFMIRMVIIFAVWMFFSWRQRAISAETDANPEGYNVKKVMATSSIGIIGFALAICVAAFDWVMSIEPHWFSTIFGVYIFAGSFVSGMAFITITTIKLREWGYFQGYITDNHLHDLGKFLFGFSVFWAYIWISQYLLIWYANIPEETMYYVDRHHHWGAVFWINLGLNFIAPFFLLMSRPAKRNPKRLLLVCSILFVGHFVDLYLMVAPKIFHHHGAHLKGFGIIQLLEWLGFFGLFIFVVGKALSKVKLAPTGDPQLEEGLHLHQ